MHRGSNVIEASFLSLVGKNNIERGAEPVEMGARLVHLDIEFASTRFRPRIIQKSEDRIARRDGRRLCSWLEKHNEASADRPHR